MFLFMFQGSVCDDLAVFSMFLLVFHGSVCDDWLCSQCFYLCSREVFVTIGCVLNVSTCVPGKCL